MSSKKKNVKVNVYVFKPQEVFLNRYRCNSCICDFLVVANVL